MQSCSNPECFYLHEIGSEDDSFSKDEIISAYTRYVFLKNISLSSYSSIYLNLSFVKFTMWYITHISSFFIVQRSRVPQVISNSLHRRSGSRLPPPVDDFCNSSTSSSKIMVKNSSNVRFLIPFYRYKCCKW